MHFAMVGTRGIPANYGGFETAVEEISVRLVAKGHRVTVFCRGVNVGRPSWRGVELINVPAVKDRRFETLTSSFATLPHLRRLRPDSAVLFNSANSPILPLLKALHIPTAVHVDGLEWMRSKWGKVGRQYYRLAELAAVRARVPLIADARGIADYYLGRYGRSTELITYGAPIRPARPEDEPLLAGRGMSPSAYHLVVARLEPENHVMEIIQGYRQSRCSKSLVLVGDNPYETDYTRSVKRIVERDDKIWWLGSVWDQELLDALYANCATYVHGHSVGGTNPSLLRAMGAGAPVVAWDVSFNREVAGERACFFDSSGSLAAALTQVEDAGFDLAGAGAYSMRRAAEEYRWDEVADAYERLLVVLAGRNQRGTA